MNRERQPDQEDFSGFYINQPPKTLYDTRKIVEFDLNRPRDVKPTTKKIDWAKLAEAASSTSPSIIAGENSITKAAEVISTNPPIIRENAINLREVAEIQKGQSRGKLKDWWGKSKRRSSIESLKEKSKKIKRLGIIGAGLMAAAIGTALYVKDDNCIDSSKLDKGTSSGHSSTDTTNYNLDYSGESMEEVLTSEVEKSITRTKTKESERTVNKNDSWEKHSDVLKHVLWLDNGTKKPEGNELGLQISKKEPGTITIQYNPKEESSSVQVGNKTMQFKIKEWLKNRYGVFTLSKEDKPREQIVVLAPKMKLTLDLKDQKPVMEIKGGKLMQVPNAEVAKLVMEGSGQTKKSDMILSAGFVNPGPDGRLGDMFLIASSRVK